MDISFDSTPAGANRQEKWWQDFWFLNRIMGRSN